MFHYTSIVLLILIIITFYSIVELSIKLSIKLTPLEDTVSPPVVKIVIITQTKDSADFLGEWIWFYQLQGIDKIILLDNSNNEDISREIEKFGSFVERIPSTWNGRVSAQHLDIRRIILERISEIDFLLHIDDDEFIASPTNTIRDLAEIVDKRGDIAQLGFCWRNVGTQGLKTLTGSTLLSARRMQPLDETRRCDRWHRKSMLNLKFANQTFWTNSLELGIQGDIVHGFGFKETVTNILDFRTYHVARSYEHLERRVSTWNRSSGALTTTKKQKNAVKVKDRNDVSDDILFNLASHI